MTIDTQEENFRMSIVAGTTPGEKIDVLSPIYSKSYETFSGVDVKITINGEIVPEFQAISMRETVNGITGDLIYVVFEEDFVKEKFLFMNGATVVLGGSTQDGNCTKLILEDVRFTEWSFGLSVDDIVSEARLTFKANKILPWKKLQLKV